MSSNSEKIQTEDKIFTAASAVFEEKGFDGTRMQEIADRAGINKALLHYYFRSKEKLFSAVFTLVAKKMFKRILHFFSDPNLSIEEKIHLFYKEHIGILQKNPNLPAFIINEINKNPKLIKEIINDADFSYTREIIKEQYEKEVKNGRFRDYDPFFLFINIVALSVFPFAARGIVNYVLNEIGMDFNKEMEKRKTALPEFIIRAVRQQDYGCHE